CLRRRLEREADGARLALRRERVDLSSEVHRVGSAGLERVLEERSSRGVVFEQLGEAALLGPHGLVDRLRRRVRGLPDEDLARLLGAAQRIVLGLRSTRERVDEIRRRRIQIPLDYRAALHVYEHRADVAAEDVLVVPVDVVVALLAGCDAE